MEGKLTGKEKVIRELKAYLGVDELPDDLTHMNYHELRTWLKEKRIIEVGNYMEDTHASIKNVAEQFHVSVPVVVDYINCLKMKNPQQYQVIRTFLEKRNPKNYQTSEVRNRISDVYDMVKAGYTIPEIAKHMDVTEMVIQRDIDHRMEPLKREELKKILHQHSLANLSHKK